MSASSPLVQLLQLLVKQKGSDLHLAANSSPMIRLHGDLVKVDMPPLKSTDIEALLADVLSPPMREELLKNKASDFSVKIPQVGIFRGNIFYQRYGLAAVFRALSENIPTLEQLKLPPICKVASSYPHGLVLVTGPTGSGKSTTLAAMINHINNNQRGHILTLEDPIEFHHESKRCMVNQRQLNSHFTSFASALKAALREDPDVILVGEMRDIETIQLAITAAETGHLVFATLHTNTAAKSVDRIIDSFPPEQQAQIRTMLSESLRAVISQKLIPTADHKGRLAVHDVLVVNSAVGNLIREGKTYQIPSVMQTARKDGMLVMDQVLLEAVRGGLVAGLDAWEYANDKNAFQQYAPQETGIAGLTQAGATGAPATAGANPNATRTGSGAARPTTPLTSLKKTGS